MTTDKVSRIGVTGGIGSGKSTICSIFRLLGVPIYEADIRAKYLMVYHDDLRQRLIKAFGESVYREDGSLNRAYLTELIFKDQSKGALVNRLVHPVVNEDYKLWEAEHRPYAYTIKEAALLFESGSYKDLDKIITVTAPYNDRVHRILMRDHHRSKTQVEDIVKNQWPEEDKIKQADFVIHNDNSRLVIPQVIKIHENLSA